MDENGRGFVWNRLYGPDLDEADGNDKDVQLRRQWLARAPYREPV
jgi:hypothetical protein